MATDFPGRDPDRSDELARLPHGRHGLPAEFVEHNQRERLISSFTHIIGEHGYWDATINSITSGANVSSRTFYKYFDSIEECYVASFDRAIEWIRPPLVEAFSSQSEWVESIRASLLVVLSEFTAFPDGARLLTAEPFVAGSEVAIRHRDAVEQMVPYLRRGRELRKGPDPLPETTERGLLGAANSLIGRQVFAGVDRPLTELAPDLLQFLLTPYLGAAAALEISRG